MRALCLQLELWIFLQYLTSQMAFTSNTFYRNDLSVWWGYASMISWVFYSRFLTWGKWRMFQGILSFLKIWKFWQTCIFLLHISLFRVLFLLKTDAFSSHCDTISLQDTKNEIIEERCYCPDEIHSSNSVFYFKYIPCISKLQYSSCWLIFVISNEGKLIQQSNYTVPDFSSLCLKHDKILLFTFALSCDFFLLHAFSWVLSCPHSTLMVKKDITVMGFVYDFFWGISEKKKSPETSYLPDFVCPMY